MDKNVEDIQKIFLVWRSYTYLLYNQEHDEVKLIGIRRTQESANEYVKAAQVLYPYSSVWVDEYEVEP